MSAIRFHGNTDIGIKPCFFTDEIFSRLEFPFNSWESGTDYFSNSSLNRVCTCVCVWGGHVHVHVLTVEGRSGGHIPGSWRKRQLWVT